MLCNITRKLLCTSKKSIRVYSCVTFLLGMQMFIIYIDLFGLLPDIVSRKLTERCRCIAWCDKALSVRVRTRCTGLHTFPVIVY